MKKTLTINLRSTVFNIDEDAYELLDEYLQNLRVYFRKEDSISEIMDDIEARIAELFTEKMSLGFDVMDIFQVKEIIKKIGSPKDFDETNEDDSDTIKEDQQPKEETSDAKGRKKPYRDIDNKMIGGVCSGLSHLTGWDTTVIRIITALVLIFFVVGPIPNIAYKALVLIYALLWIIVPAAKTAEQKLEMRGEKVNLENISKTIASSPINTNNVGGTLGTIIKVLSICLAAIVGIPLLIGLMGCLIALIAVGLGISSIPFFGGIAGAPLVATIALFFVIVIPLLVIIYQLLMSSKVIKSVSPVIKNICLFVWIIAFLVLFFSGMKFFKDNRFNNISFPNISESDFEIESSGIFANIDTVMPEFNSILIKDDLIANICLEQSATNESKLLINGDENYIDKIEWNISDNKTLELSANNRKFNRNKNLIIKIISPKFEKISVESAANILAESKINSDIFEVAIKGVGSFNADSIYANEIYYNIKGAGNASITGKASKSNYLVEGAGMINAANLVSDTVTATVRGVGLISCYPINVLDGTVSGAGKITYKEEPTVKNMSVSGVGVISKED